MIVIGADTHKRTHTLAAVLAGSGRIAGEPAASAREPGYREMLAWGRTLDVERVWAIEDAATSPPVWSASWSTPASGWCGCRRS